MQVSSSQQRYLCYRSSISSPNACQNNGGLDVGGEDDEHHFLRDIILHPAQAPGLLPCRAVEAHRGALLSGRDEGVSSPEAVLQVLQRAAHRRVGRHPRLRQPRQEGAHPNRARPDLLARLLVLANRVDGLLDPERELDDLLQAAQWISHPYCRKKNDKSAVSTN